MDSFELNKIIAAVLMVALLVIGLGKVADGIFHVTKPKNPGYQVKIENQLSEILTAPRHSGDVRSSNNLVSAFLASPRYSGNTGGTDNRTNIGSSFASRDYNALPSSVADLGHQTLQRHSSSYGN